MNYYYLLIFILISILLLYIINLYILKVYQKVNDVASEYIEKFINL